jgi:hypothetical protein
MAGEGAKKATPAAPEAEKKDVAEEKAVFPPPPGAKDKTPQAGDECKALIIVESEWHFRILYLLAVQPSVPLCDSVAGKLCY